jgi:hypothetical protein
MEQQTERKMENLLGLWKEEQALEHESEKLLGWETEEQG